MRALMVLQRCLYTSESDVCRCQMSDTDGPRAERMQKYIMAVDP